MTTKLKDTFPSRQEMKGRNLRPLRRITEEVRIGEIDTRELHQKRGKLVSQGFILVSWFPVPSSSPEFHFKLDPESCSSPPLSLQCWLYRDNVLSFL